MKLLEYFPALTLRPENAQELKGMILQLAVQGKLTRKWRADNPELISGENSAEALLEQIKEEKARLIEEKLIRKPKELSPINANDVLFNIPQQWCWSRSGKFIEVIRGITFPKGAKSLNPSSNEIPCLRTANVQERVDWDDLIFVSKDYVNRKDQFVMKDDILISLANSRELVGKVCIVENELEQKFTFGGFIGILRPIIFNQRMLVHYLRSPQAREVLIGSSSQTTNIANISVGKLNTLPIPIPPLAEQKAIVAIVEQLLAEVDQLVQQTHKRLQLKRDYATASLRQLSEAPLAAEEQHGSAALWAQLAPHFPAVFDEKDTIQKLRDTILTLAVQGKLTQQWRADNPELISGENSAEALLEQIKEEKAKMVKEKEIRKEKALPPISEGEVPYELPERWVWTRFQTIIFEGLTGLERAKRFQSLDNQFDYFKMNNIGDNGACSWVNMVRVDANKEEVQKYKLRRGDFLFNTRNSYELVGKTCIIDKDPIEPLLFNNNILKVDFGGKLDTIYINLMFNSPVIKELLNNKKSSTTNVAAIYQGKLMELLVIIPPLAEQKAIVAKVNRLMTWCDELEAQVEQRQELLNQTMQAVKREALADTQEKESPPALAAESQAAYQNTP